jgi:hypothetical protein
MITFLIFLGFASLAVSTVYLTASLIKGARRANSTYRCASEIHISELEWEREVERAIAGY